MTKNKSARGVEVVATILSAIIIVTFAVLPQFIVLPRLNRIKAYAREAVEHIDDEELLKENLNAVTQELRQAQWLLLLIYSSADVSDLELATDRANVLSANNIHEKTQVLREICNIYSAADTLAEKEHLTVANVF